MDPYCRSGREYKLKQTCYDTLRAYIESTPATTFFSPPDDRFGQSSVRLPARQTPLWTTQRTLPQIPLVPYITATSGSVSTGPLQAVVSPVTYQARIIPKILQDPHIHNDSQSARQALLLSYTQPSSPSSPSTPEPSFSALAVFIIPVLFLGSVGAVTYGGYRLLNLGKWALKEMEGK